METLEATCPRCKKTDWYGAELMGRYTLCTHCRCRFYIPVPDERSISAKAGLSGPRVVEESSRATTLDDLLLDTQQGERLVITLLRRQEKVLTALTWILGIVAVATLLNLGCSIVQAIR